ncbi:MAG: hypothetical protein JW884_04280 [Deltaproteobacteria bacterium]|nr:hypothetical protein [Deltaproteobacteria bacterium]
MKFGDMAKDMKKTKVLVQEIVESSRMQAAGIDATKAVVTEIDGVIRKSEQSVRDIWEIANRTNKQADAVDLFVYDVELLAGRSENNRGQTANIPELFAADGGSENLESENNRVVKASKVKTRQGH